MTERDFPWEAEAEPYYDPKGAFYCSLLALWCQLSAPYQNREPSSESPLRQRWLPPRRRPHARTRPFAVSGMKHEADVRWTVHAGDADGLYAAAQSRRSAARWDPRRLGRRCRPSASAQARCGAARRRCRRRAGWSCRTTRVRTPGLLCHRPRHSLSGSAVRPQPSRCGCACQWDQLRDSESGAALQTGRA